MFWEAYIYSLTTGKDWRLALERLTYGTVDISEWPEFEFYDLVWFWNNQLDDTKPMLGRWIGLSHRVGNMLYYYIISQKGRFLSRTAVHHLTDDEPRDPNVQERIFDYHGSLESTVGNEYFGTILDGYNSFIKNDKEVTVKGDSNEYEYQ